MSNSNPFEILVVVTAIILIVMTAFAVVAPQFIHGIRLPQAPEFPILPDLQGQGNQTGGGWAFNQTKFVTATNETTFDAFNPDKRLSWDIGVNFAGVTQTVYQGFSVFRAGTWAIFPVWYGEPVSYLDGSPTAFPRKVTTQEIVDNFDGQYSIFAIDQGNNMYEAYVFFSPLPGYADLVSSWNIGHGFTVMMVGNTYEQPTWTDQVVNYLGFGAAIIGFFIYEAAYAVDMMGIAGQLIAGPNSIGGAVGSGVAVLVIIIFAGAMLMFIRGSSGNK